MSNEAVVRPVMGALLQGASVDRAIADIAEAQHGVVARSQLTAAGLGRRAIGHRLECGRLQRVERGVYAVGHRVRSSETIWMTAVLAAGAVAVLSHRSAAALWGLRGSSRRRTDVTVPGPRRSRSLVEFHQAMLPPDEVTVCSGVPVTTVPRTLLDLASVVERRHVERAIQEADVRRLHDPLSLLDLVARYPGRRGTPLIKAILADGRVGGGVPRSELEGRFLAFLDRFTLPRPEVNANLCVRGRWVEVDCLWRSARLIVELDGRATHDIPTAFERDRARDRRLSVEDWRVIRVTWRQLHLETRALAEDLRTMLMPVA